MKMTLKHKNGEFLVMPLKHVLSVMGHVNPPESQNSGEIAHKNGHKCKIGEFLVMPVK
jgi:hypothetical protein